MNAYGIAKYKSFKNIDNYLDSNVRFFENYPPYVDLVGKYKNNLLNMENNMSKSYKQTAGITKEKNVTKKIMCDFWGSVCATVAAYALSINDKALYNDWKNTSGDIYRLPEVEAVAKCKYLNDSIRERLDVLQPYLVTADLLNQGLILINDFNDTIGSGRTKGNQRSELIKVLDDNFSKIDDLLNALTLLTNGHYFNNVPEFKSGFAGAAIINAGPTTHTELEATIYKKGTTESIVGATVKEIKSGKTAVSDIMGVATLSTFTGGDNLSFEVSANGYVTESIIKTVKRGKKVQITVELTAN